MQIQSLLEGGDHLSWLEGPENDKSSVTTQLVPELAGSDKTLDGSWSVSCCRVIISSYLLSLHVPRGYEDAHSPVREVAVQLLSPKQGTASQHAALQKAPRKYTGKSAVLLQPTCLAECSQRRGKSQTLLSDVTSTI